MRRPLFTACLCLVIVTIIARILTGAAAAGDGGLPPDGSLVRVTGRIDTRTSEQIILKSISIIQKNQQYSYSGKLQCELENIKIAGSSPGTVTGDGSCLKIGQKIVLEGVFTQFATATNPGEFDARTYYAGKGIGGKVKKAQLIAVGEKYDVFREMLYSCRRVFHDRLADVFPAKEASVMQTLLLGEKEELDQDVKALYQKSGIAHILSISGLHITLIGMGVYKLLKRAGMPVKIAAVCGGLTLIGYGFMVGMSVSSSRAIGMYLLRMLGIFVGRTYDMLTALGLLAAFLVIQNPEILGDVSFLMSFGAVAGVCILTPLLAGNAGRNRTDRTCPKEQNTDGSQHSAESRWKYCHMPEWLRATEETMKGLLVESGYQRNKYREGWHKRIYEGIRKGLEILQNSFAASVGVILFTLPIQLWFFYEIPVYSAILNLLVLPFMSILMAVGMIALIPGLGIMGTVDCLILWWYEWICNLFGKLPGAVWCTGRPKVWQIVCYYSGIFFLIFLRGHTEAREDQQVLGRDAGNRIHQRKFTAKVSEVVTAAGKGIVLRISRVQNRSLVWIVSGLLICLVTIPFERGNRVIFLDVGQGDGIVVETAYGVYLFDCGSTSRRKVGEYVLKPYLKSRGICSLRGVFVSHPDEDHMNGILELLENGTEWGITVEQLFLPAILEEKREEAFDKLLVTAESAGVAVCYIKCGDEIREGQIKLRCLHPENNTSLVDANAYSECFYVEILNSKLVGEISILLTGDVEGEGEWQLVQELRKLREQQELCGKGDFKVDILKVAHHGSSYSTGSEFLSAASPAAAIISCGRNNSYGHPHTETLQRLDNAAIPWHSTMDYGALTVTVHGHGNRLRGYLGSK